VPKELAHFETRRRRENPMEIGLIPPDFLFKAIARPPKKIGVISTGQRPDKTKLTNAVNAVRKCEPVSWH